MQILEGSSDKRDAYDAVCEATCGWEDDISPDILFVFHSSRQNPNTVASVLAECFPNAVMVGATTAGEWISGKHLHGSLIIIAISSSDIRWAVTVTEHLDQFSTESCTNICESLLGQLNIQMSDLNPEHHFCLSFIDGLSKCEENTISMLSAELRSIPLLGGSAGDDLKFEHTFVLADGKAWQNAAVFVLAESKLPFKTIKHQHFTPGDIDTIITKAGVSERIVYHLDGMPAAERYAQLLGLAVGDLNAEIFSKHPLIYEHQQECYVRSINQVGENNSLIFYCAIEEGMILNLCSHQDMVQQFGDALQELTSLSNNISLVFIFNCVLRQLEAESLDGIQGMAKKIAAKSQHSIGFDTYGEQWQGLHINQTMVALALYEHE